MEGKVLAVDFLEVLLGLASFIIDPLVDLLDFLVGFLHELDSFLQRVFCPRVERRTLVQLRQGVLEVAFCEPHAAAFVLRPLFDLETFVIVRDGIVVAAVELRVGHDASLRHVFARGSFDREVLVRFLEEGLQLVRDLCQDRRTHACCLRLFEEAILGLRQLDRRVVLQILNREIVRSARCQQGFRSRLDVIKQPRCFLEFLRNRFHSVSFKRRVSTDIVHYGCKVVENRVQLER
mmetsp:Transcript_11327/g.12821  ORF Transcript_11327/g.12821 Transcript_11327/m.12821 type:complete len:235 (-) Transcript_11327:351-1055(-)